MQGRTYADLPLQALPMAVWRRKPKTKVPVHSSPATSAIDTKGAERRKLAASGMARLQGMSW